MASSIRIKTPEVRVQMRLKAVDRIVREEKSFFVQAQELLLSPQQNQ
jgi:hypothetical protein